MAGDGVAEDEAIGAPHWPQNWKPGGFSWPHWEHMGASEIPHWPQNFIRGGLSNWQREQCTRRFSPLSVLAASRFRQEERGAQASWRAARWAKRPPAVISSA